MCVKRTHALNCNVCLSVPWRQVWMHGTDSSVQSSLAIGPGGLLAVGCDDSNLYMFANGA